MDFKEVSDYFRGCVAGDDLSKRRDQFLGNCVRSKKWTLAAEALSTVLRSHPQHLQELLNDHELANWQTYYDLGAIYEHNDGLEESLIWYQRAVEALEKRRNHAVDIDSRLANIGRLDSAELFVGLIRVSLRMHRATSILLSSAMPNAHNLHGQDWTSQGLLFAEQGRSRALLDMLTLENDVDPDEFRNWKCRSYIYRQYEDLRQNSRPHWHENEPSEKEMKLRENQQKLHWMEVEMLEGHGVKAECGLEKLWSMAYLLLARTSFENSSSSMCAAIEPDTLVLHCNTSEAGTTIFAISNEAIIRVREYSLDRRTLQQQILAYRKIMSRSTPDVGVPDRQFADRVCSLLANHLLLPFEDLIVKRKHIIFVPCHELNLFPLSLLPFRGQPLCLQKYCSQIPSLSMLQQLVRMERTRSQIKASILGYTDKNSCMAGVGTVAIAELFHAHPKATNMMSKDDFNKHYEDASLVFIASQSNRARPGYSSWQTNSLLDLTLQNHDQSSSESSSLRVTDLSRLQSNAAVVVFSACLADSGEMTNDNDITGFSHAILQSGAQAYVGALWPVSDWATMLLMVLFHRGLSKSPKTVCVAEGLQNAVVQFYNLTVEKAVALLNNVRTSWERGNDLNWIPRGWLNDGGPALDNLIKDMQDPDRIWDFQDPSHWAAWVVVGRGNVCLLNGKPFPAPAVESSSANTVTHAPLPVRCDREAYKPTEWNESPVVPQRSWTTSSSLSQIPDSPLPPLQPIHSVDSAGLPSHYPSHASPSPSPNAQRHLQQEFPLPPSSTPLPQLPPRRASEVSTSYSPITCTSSIPRRPVASPPQISPVSPAQHPPESHTSYLTPPHPASNAFQQQQVPMSQPMYYPPPPTTTSPLPGPPPGNFVPQPGQSYRKPVPQHRPYSDPHSSMQHTNLNPPNTPLPCYNNSVPVPMPMPMQNPPPPWNHQPQFPPQPPQPYGPPNPQANWQRRTTLGGPPTAAQAHQQWHQQHPLQPPQGQGKPGSRMSKLMKHSGMKTAMKLGTGMLIGGLIGGEVADLAGDGGDFVGDLGGGLGFEGGDFGGGGGDFGDGDAAAAGGGGGGGRSFCFGRPELSTRIDRVRDFRFVGLVSPGGICAPEVSNSCNFWIARMSNRLLSSFLHM